MIINNKEYSNIKYLCRNFTGSKKEFGFEELLEYPYYSSIIENIHDILGNEFYKYEFLIYSKVNQKAEASDDVIIPMDRNPQLIVFYISDETGSIPFRLAAKCKAVFKILLRGQSEGNVFYFPLGYANGKEHEITPILERRNNVFFMGQLNRSRIKLYKEIAGLRYIPDNILLTIKRFLPADLSSKFKNSKIGFTSAFKSGLDSSAYNEFLYNSRIIICPYGAVTPETFRHYEAMRAGCIVITLKMPEVLPFNGAPIIQLNNWGQLWSTIHDLLNDEPRMQKIHQETLLWWENVCSEKSVAEYVIKKIKNYD